MQVATPVCRACVVRIEARLHIPSGHGAWQEKEKGELSHVAAHDARQPSKSLVWHIAGPGLVFFVLVLLLQSLHIL